MRVLPEMLPLHMQDWLWESEEDLSHTQVSKEAQSACVDSDHLPSTFG